MKTTTRSRITRSLSWRLPLWGVLGLLLLAGCASTKVTDREVYQGPRLAKPQHIIVYDFADSPSDLPGWSRAAQSYAGQEAPMTEKEREAGRKLGVEVANELVEKINGMGLTAVKSDLQSAVLNDIILVGFFTSIDEGSAVKRIVIGFGAGAASVGAHAEGYHMTENGIEFLGSGTVSSGGPKGPGLAVPAIVTIATANPIGLAVGGAVKVAGAVSGVSTAKGSARRIAKEIAEILEKRFKEEGWI